MKILSVSQELLYDSSRLTITFDKGQNGELIELIEGIGPLDQEADYEVIIRKKKKKRSLDANAYFWVLLGQLSTKLKIRKSEMYKSYIRDTGAYEVVPVREDLVEKWKSLWETKGDGWVIEDTGECKNTKGYHLLRCYYGTSQYTSEEMAHIIDMVVEDCHEQGIQTMTPDKIKHLKELWRKKNGTDDNNNKDR